MFKPSAIFCFLLASPLAASGVSALPDTGKTALDGLMIYDGHWEVRASKPWSGLAPGAVDDLVSQCKRYTLYLACEQTVNAKPQALIVFTLADGPGQFNTRIIAPNGLAGGRGNFTASGNHWTYLDKPAAGLTGPWSRVENFIVDLNNIRFEEI
ncbi:MAG: hypothetical protein H0W74_11160 [Sphingosinicella sp.]|nr:hypothetical protein [Sphingosinicella sp.]